MQDGSPEVYVTVQGEGRHVGLPVIFVRFSLCNLHCVWCDTPYTWNFGNKKHNWSTGFDKEKEIVDMTSKQLAQVIHGVGKANHNVVFTGGEPLIQQDAIVETISLLGEGHFQIETNGTIMPSPELQHQIQFYNVSPKLEDSGNNRKQRDRKLPMTCFSDFAHNGRCCFKFVITRANKDSDLWQICELVEKYRIPHEAVYLMPEGIETVDMISWSREVAKICMETGYSLSTRLQVILYGDKRAV